MKTSTLVIGGIIGLVAYQLLKGGGGLGGLEPGGEGGSGLGGLIDNIGDTLGSILGGVNKTPGTTTVLDSGGSVVTSGAGSSPTPSAPVQPTNPFVPSVPVASTPTQQAFIGSSPENLGQIILVNAPPNQVPTSVATESGNWLNVSQIYGYAGY